MEEVVLYKKNIKITKYTFDKNQSDTKIDYEISDRPNDIPPGKCVCISTQSTAQGIVKMVGKLLLNT